VKRHGGIGVLALVLVASAVHLPQLLWPDARFYADVLSPARLLALGSFAKLACLVTGVVFGFRIASRLERTNPARRPWALLSVWLALWTFAQSVLTVYSTVRHVRIPVPSLADPTFYFGFAALYWAQLEFIRVYRRSGFPVGTAREHATTALITAVGLAAIAAPLLVPLARTGGMVAENLILASYPVLDLVAVVPAIVLLRIALAFRPGRVWPVWSSLASAFLFFAIGDLISLYVWPTRSAAFDPAIHLMYELGYLFAALGMKLQWELVAAPSAARPR
jgi:hypothetical protein